MKDETRGMIRGRIQEGYRKVGGKSEAGRREVGGRSEEFHLNWHPNGIQNPEFKPYCSKKIIKYSRLLISLFCPAKVQKKFHFVMKKMGNFDIM